MVRYTLTYGTVVKTLTHNPEGYNEQAVEFSRNERYHGIFRTMNSSFRFVKEGADLLRVAFFADGIEAGVSVLIEAYNKLTLSWEIIFTGDCDFSSVKIERDYVECPVVETGLSALITANETTEYTIDLPTDTILSYSGIRLYAGAPTWVNPVTSPNSYFQTPLCAYQYRNHSVPLLVTALNDNTQGGYSAYDVAKSTLSPVNFPNTEFFKANRNAIVDVEINWSEFELLTYLFEDDYEGTSSLNRWYGRLYVDVYDASGTLKTSTQIKQISLIPTQLIGNYYTNSTGSSVSYTGSFDLLEGESIRLNWEWEPTSANQKNNSNLAKLKVTGASISIDVQTVLPTIEVPAFTAIGLFEQIIQNIDPTASVESDYLGALPQNNIMLFTSGDAIRGITDPTIKITLSDFFDSMASIYGLGMGVNGQVARLEEMTYFYNSLSGISFGEVSGLLITTAPSFMPKNLEAGYNTNEYGELNGRDEFNARQQWLFPYTKINGEVSTTSPVRADMYGIDNLRISLYGDSENTDNAADNEVFIVDGEYSAQASGVRYYIVSRSKYTYISGLENPDTAFNMVFSPRSCLVRNYAKISAALWKLSDPITLSSYDKNVSLQYAAGGSISYENANIVAKTGVFAPIYFEFNISQKTGLWSSLAVNGMKKSSFIWNGNTYYGYITDAAVNVDHREEMTVRMIADINTNFQNLT